MPPAAITTGSAARDFGGVSGAFRDDDGTDKDPGDRRQAKREIP